MADVLTPSTTATGPTRNGKTKKGLRKALSKWKDRLKGPKRPSTSSSTQPLPTQVQQPQQSQLAQPTSQPPAPSALFFPTTETTVLSPNDPRHAHSNSSSPQSTLRRRPSKSRRNTAPADYFSSTDEGADRVLPMNKITTTITATAPQKQRLRYRLSLSKRSSYQPVASPPFPASPVSSPPNTIPLASPTPSAPNPAEHEDRRATFQFTTAAEIAAKIKADEEKLAQAAEVIRRDKPKDWLDPGWREREEKERERVLAEKKLEEDQLLEAEKRDAEAVAGVRIGRDGVDSGPLRRWEWGR